MVGLGLQLHYFAMQRQFPNLRYSNIITFSSTTNSCNNFIIRALQPHDCYQHIAAWYSCTASANTIAFYIILRYHSWISPTSPNNDSQTNKRQVVVELFPHIGLLAYREQVLTSFLLNKPYAGN